MSDPISLPPELEARIQSRVSSGQFSSAAEVIGEAMRVLEAAESLEAARLASLRKDIEAAVDDFRAGRDADLDFDAIRARAAAALRDRHSKAS